MGRAGTALLVFAALLLTAGCGSSTVTEKSLKKKAETVQSIASEGALLAESRAQGSTTQTFTREHARELSKQASGIATRLRKARIAPQVEPNAHLLAGATDATSVELHRLERAGPDEAERIDRRLNRLAEQAEQLAS